MAISVAAPPPALTCTKGNILMETNMEVVCGSGTQARKVQLDQLCVMMVNMDIECRSCTKVKTEQAGQMPFASGDMPMTSTVSASFPASVSSRGGSLMKVNMDMVCRSCTKVNKEQAGQMPSAA